VRNNYKSENRAKASKASASATRVVAASHSTRRDSSSNKHPASSIVPHFAAASFSQLLTTDYGLNTNSHFRCPRHQRFFRNHDLLRAVRDNYKSENRANIDEMSSFAIRAESRSRTTRRSSSSIKHPASSITLLPFCKAPHVATQPHGIPSTANQPTRAAASFSQLLTTDH